MKSITNKAMSLGEVLICLAVVGLIAGITLPVMFSTVPNKNEALHKKANYLLEHAVSDIVNNDTYYPIRNVITTTGTGEDKVVSIDHKDYGLRNTGLVVVDGVAYGSDSDSDADAKAQKFCRIMASKFKLAPGSTVDCTSEAEWSFKSIDGIQWKMPIYDFSGADDDDTKDDRIIKFRTGDRRGGDCAENANPVCVKPNIFFYEITSNGRLEKASASTDSFK